jgi:pimeloyl-ACP methyl ester carboxylesterase
VVPDRRGYWPNPPADREDFDEHADDIAALLATGEKGRMHLVAQSYGGLIGLLATARRPEAVRSLTVIEPPVVQVARGRPNV